MSLRGLARSVAYSPAWFIPFDEFAQRVRATGVAVPLDRLVDGVWVPQDDAAVRTPSGAIAFPGLGRGTESPAAPPKRYRARFEAAGYQVLHGAALTFGDALGLFDIEAFFPNPIAVKVFPRTLAVRGQPVRAVGGALH